MGETQPEVAGGSGKWHVFKMFLAIPMSERRMWMQSLMLDATCRKTVLFAFYCLSCRVLDSSVQASFVKIFSKSSLVAMTSRDGNGTVSVHG